MNDGGPAFPVDGGDVANGGIGISARDYFAAAALVGDLAASVNARERPDPDDLANYAYAVADAMLAARKVTHE